MKRLTHIATAALLVSLSATACNDDPLLDLGDRLPPTISISSPDNNGTYTAGAAISFDGSGVDQDGNLLAGAQLVWTSSLDGQIGTGATFTRDDLSEGAHEITLTGTDGFGETNSTSVDITVEAVAVNDPPVAIITAPADQSEYFDTEVVVLTGEGTDTEDGALTGASLVWTSDLDGEIGTGEELQIDGTSFTPGVHNITLTATDSEGETGTDAIQISVAEAASDVSFATDVQPYFTTNCTTCHGGAAPTGGIALDSYDGFVTSVNGDGVPVVLIGDAGSSPVIIAIGTGHAGAPHGTDIETALTTWINDGAPNN